MLKKAIKFTAGILPLAFIAGIGISKYEISTGTITAEILKQISIPQIYFMTICQTLFYAIFCSMIGYLLAEKTGLIQSFRIKYEKLKPTLIAGALCGIFFFAVDYLIFAKLITQVATYYHSYVFSISYLLSEVFYGGVIEELMLRFFLMSLLIFILWKVFAHQQDYKSIPLWIMIVSNIISSLLFAAGHLPATVTMFGHLNSLILIRCFILNGSFGIIFGRLYRKYGIQYAMIAHALTHLFCDLLLFLCINL